MIESNIFKLQASAYMRHFFPIYLRHNWWIPIVVVLPFVALSFVNINFIYVSLMALFFVVPMMLGFSYFYYATGRECVTSIRRCRIKVSQIGFRRIFLDDEDNETGDADYTWADYNVSVKDESILLQNKNNRYDVQIIPLDAFESEESRNGVSEMVRSIG